ncbi:MAG: hypothetical protein IPL26_16825 [Leptospiraceae bacterium]|nr:hypothetical protein [Leptospiraceae bacterium]
MKTKLTFFLVLGLLSFHSVFAQQLVFNPNIGEGKEQEETESANYQSFQERTMGAYLTAFRILNAIKEGNSLELYALISISESAMQELVESSSSVPDIGLKKHLVYANNHIANSLQAARKTSFYLGKENTVLAAYWYRESVKSFIYASSILYQATLISEAYSE